MSVARCPVAWPDRRWPSGHGHAGTYVCRRLRLTVVASRFCAWPPFVVRPGTEYDFVLLRVLDFCVPEGTFHRGPSCVMQLECCFFSSKLEGKMHQAHLISLRPPLQDKVDEFINETSGLTEQDIGEWVSFCAMDHHIDARAR